MKREAGLMSERGLRSIEAYLRRLRTALQGAAPEIIHEALAAAEEHLRAEVAASPGHLEGDVLEFISNTYGSPEDLAAVYLPDTDRSEQNCGDLPDPRFVLQCI